LFDSGLFLSDVLNVTLFWEGVRTSKITSSKGQNIESILKDDHNIERSERRKSERQKECRKCNFEVKLSTFWFYLWRQERSEHWKSNLSDFQILKKCQLPMA
jgi:hypothetical protein